MVYPSTEASPGAVVFSHQSHGAKGAGYQCKRCHTAAPDRAPTITMDRIRAGEACGVCHDGRTKGPRGRQAASPVRDCSSCHMPATDTVIKLNRMDAVAFSHTKHLGVDAKNKHSRLSGFSCIECHPAPFERAAKGSPGMDLPHARGGCAQCHNGRKRQDGMPAAFAATTRCLTCHRPLTPSSPAQPATP
jgi:c(7)-type cytochrome triheme protein